MHVSSDRVAAGLVGGTPVTYLVFDLLHLGGRSLMPEPWRLRRDELEALAPTVTDRSPFDEKLPGKAVFVTPTLVVDVEYRERTSAGILRHPSYKGTRVDKGPADVDTGAWVHPPGR
jgi:ATP-dependent DNA ligase